MSAIITLTTDFGSGSPYVAAMKGVIIGINPAVRLIDISHSVGPQNVHEAAVLLAEAATWFPAGTIHVAVIDPGVGTQRKLIYARIGDQQYLALDNGLLSLLAKRHKPARIVELMNSEIWLPDVSQTFHGRDILAPVAAQLSLGLEPDRLGSVLTEMQMLDWPEPRLSGNRIDGVVRWIDHFGNLITNIGGSLITDEMRTPKLKSHCAGQEILGLAATYGERKQNEVTAIVGSSGYLEIAVVNGNAAQTLQAQVGAPVIVEC
jgi:S-adenosyl-L-methionine hydrolase (adenosine-forming)